MDKKILVPIFLILALLISGCSGFENFGPSDNNESEKNNTAKFTDHKTGSFLIYSLQNRGDKLHERYSILSGNEVREVSNQIVFDSEKVANVENATIKNKLNRTSGRTKASKISEVTLKPFKWIREAEDELDDNFKFIEANYYPPLLAEHYYNESNPLFALDFYSDSKAHRFLYNVREGKKVKRISGELKNITLCNTVYKFSKIETKGCVPKFLNPANFYWFKNTHPWKEATSYLKNSSEGSILTWWDYSEYLTISTGREAIPKSKNYMKIRKVSDFLASTDYKKYIDWLQNLSVDHIVLDYTMVRKYTAVSQIHNQKKTNFSHLLQVPCDRTKDGQRCKKITRNGEDYIVYKKTFTGQDPEMVKNILVPIRRNPFGNLTINGPPIVQNGNQESGFTTQYYEKVCSSDGIKTFNVSDKQKVSGCLQFSPLSKAKVLQIPEKLIDTFFVRLYLRDGRKMDEFEKVFDNDYVKVWNVNY